MAAIDFPDSPALNDTFLSNGVTYKWNGVKWYTFFASEADLISYSPSSPGLTATNVQDAIDELSSGSGNAINIDYDNSTSGLTATNVQSAIDEIGNVQQNAITDGDSNVTVSDDSSPANISFVIDATEKGYFDANGLTVSALTETSSIRYKENIEPISGALSIIKNMQGVTFDRKDGKFQNESGLIAEELYQIVPSLVKLDAEGNPDSVHYTRIIAYLIEAIKELEAKVDGKS